MSHAFYRDKSGDERTAEALEAIAARNQSPHENSDRVKLTALLYGSGLASSQNRSFCTWSHEIEPRY